MIELSILAGVIIVVSIVALWTLKKTVKTTNLVWRNVAEKLNLQFRPGDSTNMGSISGECNNHLIQVNSIARSIGPRSNTYTRFKCTYAKPISFRFELSQKDTPGHYDKILGFQDESHRDVSFYKNVKIKKGKEVEKATLGEFLNAPRRNAVQSIMRAIHSVTITNEYIEGLCPGLMDDVYLIRNCILRLTAFADIISKERNKEHPIEKAMQARVDGEIQKAVELVQKTEFDDRDDQLEAKELEGQLLYLADEKEKAGEAFKELCEEIPEDIQSKQWNRMAHSAPVNHSPLSSNTISIEDFSSKVFESAIGIFDATELFEKEYRNLEISWEGTLISVTEFSFDFVFKNTTGVKATFELMDLQTGFISNKIKAVVHFPKDQLGKLKESLNQKIEFSGKLESLDALVKNIFVAEGKIN